jgi:hypothetical protein
MISPAGFLVRAAVLAALFGVASIAGLREHASALSLTFPDGASPTGSMFWCFVYLIAYVLFILGTPVLVLGSGILWLAMRVQSRKSSVRGF